MYKSTQWSAEAESEVQERRH